MSYLNKIITKCYTLPSPALASELLLAEQPHPDCSIYLYLIVGAAAIEYFVSQIFHRNLN